MRDVRFHASDDAEIVVRAVLGAQLRNRPGHIKIGGQQVVEIRRQHADHGVRLAIQREGSADDVRVRSEAALPKLVREHGHRKRA